MKRSFITWAEWLLLKENDDPISAFKALRASAGWKNEFRPDLAPAQSNIPNQITDLLQNGFQHGGLVPDAVVRFFDLTGKNYSFVAESSRFAVGHAYPFFKEKRAGQPTGRFMFVQGYPIDRFLRDMG